MEFAVTISMETHTCPKCGTVFAMPKFLLNQRKNDYATFWCPRGHRVAFIKPIAPNEGNKDANTGPSKK